MRSTVVFVLALLLGSCGGGQTVQLKELQRVKAGAVNIVLLAPGDSLKQGKGSFVLEFRDASGTLVDAGNVTVGANMSMPGMAPMLGECIVMASDTKGRYDVSSDLGMAGTWRLQVAWDGPAGKGSASLPGTAL
jgi:YtkA-like protein